jgi:Xaa-Pro aminopeptidase
LIQLFEAKWTPAQLEIHLEAGRRIDLIRAETFEFIKQANRAGAPLDEYGVQQFVMQRFGERGLTTNHPPIVGANRNAADSHYSPPKKGSAPIRRGDLVLLDLWAKLDQPYAVYSDITWMAYCGAQVPEPMARAFAVAMGARDAGIRLVREAMAAGRTLRGFEVDDVVAATSKPAATGPTCGIGPAIPSAVRCMASAPTWITWKRTTSGPSSRGLVSPLSRRSICPNSACARRLTSLSRSAVRA